MTQSRYDSKFVLFTSFRKRKRITLTCWCWQDCHKWKTKIFKFLYVPKKASMLAVIITVCTFLTVADAAVGEQGTLTGNTYHVRGRVLMREDATVRPADILQQCKLLHCRYSSWSMINWPFPAIPSTGFYGFGLKNCKHQGEIPRLPPYPFHWESRFVQGAAYCIECCDNNRLDYAFNETWSLKCALDDGDEKELSKLEIYDLDFRFARRETSKYPQILFPHLTLRAPAN